jgi:hypothetical protein
VTFRDDKLLKPKDMAIYNDNPTRTGSSHLLFFSSSSSPPPPPCFVVDSPLLCFSFLSDYTFDVKEFVRLTHASIEAVKKRRWENQDLLCYGNPKVDGQ